jgi:hypothetical protein
VTMFTIYFIGDNSIGGGRNKWWNRHAYLSIIEFKVELYLY